MNTLSYKTKSAKKTEIDSQWHIIDATDQVVGRMSSTIAAMLRGKHKPQYTPHVDCGDFIVVINAEKIRFTGNKLAAKEYISYSGYPGGQKKRTASEVLDKKPIYIIEHAVKGMLPKNILGRQMFKKLFVYEGAEHKHQAQQPKTLEIK